MAEQVHILSVFSMYRDRGRPRSITPKFPLRVALFVLLFSLCMAVPVQSFAGDQKPRIVFFYPSTENNTYWPAVCSVLDKVGNDLGIVIEPYGFDVANRFAKVTQGIEILKRKPRPAAGIFSVAFGQSKPLLQTAQSLGIPVFLQGPLFTEELPEIGFHPRARLSQWVGYFYQDEEQKGYLLGKTLLEKAMGLNLAGQDGLIHVAGIGGDLTWYGSSLREQGLHRAVRDFKKAVLHQVIATDWTVSDSRRVAGALLARYPEVNVLWAASDQLAVGARDSMRRKGLVLGTTGLVGGLDLSLEGLRYIESGQLYTTVGSPLLSWAEILIYLYDYLNGIDFSDEVGLEIALQPLVATSENAAFHLNALHKHNMIDFSRFSKAHNPTLLRYDFSTWYCRQ